MKPHVRSTFLLRPIKISIARINSATLSGSRALADARVFRDQGNVHLGAIERAGKPSPKKGGESLCRPTQEQVKGSMTITKLANWSFHHCTHKTVFLFAPLESPNPGQSVKLNRMSPINDFYNWETKGEVLLYVSCC